MRYLHISVSDVVCRSGVFRKAGCTDAMEDDVMEQDPSPWLGRLTAVMIRGHTELRVRVDEEMSCVLVEMDGTPCTVLLGVTATGAENLRTVIASGMADLASRRQTSAEETIPAGTDG